MYLRPKYDGSPIRIALTDNGVQTQIPLTNKSHISGRSQLMFYLHLNNLRCYSVLNLWGTWISGCPERSNQIGFNGCNQWAQLLEKN